MTSVFTKVIRGELPGHFVWVDQDVVAFLDTHPHSDGHTLVIPRREESRWTDLSDAEAERLFWVAKQVGTALTGEFDCARAGLVIAGFHVPHVHLHVFPTNEMSDFDFRGLPSEAAEKTLERNASRVREALRERGFVQYLMGIE